MDAATARIITDDRFAIFADPPGVRDLALPELWERSLSRSRRRREAAAAKLIALPKTATARISAALIAAGVVGQTGPLLGAAQAATTTTTGTTSHDSVRAIQSALGLAADGIMGPRTRKAIKKFQRAHGLVADGVVGPLTRAAMAGGTTSTATASAAAKLEQTLPASTTRAVQAKLGLAADGVFGPQTRKAVRAFQRAHGLEVDGVVGPATLGALGVSGGTSTTRTATATEAEKADAPAGSGVQAAVSAALSKVGAPYSYGSTGPSSFDCSGLTSWAMRQAGISIPRTSFAQYGTGSAVSKSGIQAGDLVFFNTAGPGASDVGIATSATTVVSATTHGVMNHAIFDSYWGAHFVGAKRVA